ncbi:Demethylrebeccamycin-D-glucose O-methyltransferase [Shimia sp. SK013]|uniref:class I SAM-dependent methyltransferase n=1 Tax=Shimia sp. SK013 TaxID=1389006 RepID=UPI0006B639F6|nr:class I SAM-dependent methyltransferase [Shimia sp. SK013]KPA21409.1 Demethylrebeccamycin-D-glucose O-methyltransferase [Shimia sp. SK013]
MARSEANRDMHNKLQRAYYETRKQGGNHRILVRSTPYVINQLDRLLDESHIKSGDRILDVGCGMGKYTIPLAERGYDVEGLELSGQLLEEFQNQARGRADIATHQADLLAPPSDMIGQYDHVIGFFVLHHLFDLDQAFASCARLLKPKGRVIFLEPNPFCPLFYLQITLSPGMSWKAERGILDLTPKSTARKLTDAGFVNPQLHRFGILPPFLRNRSGAATIERGFERVSLLNPVNAFQLISAELPENGI